MEDLYWLEEQEARFNELLAMGIINKDCWEMAEYLKGDSNA